MNTRKSREKFKNFRIILDSGFSSKIVMGRIFEKLYPEKYAVIQWHTQAVNMATNIKVKVDFYHTVTYRDKVCVVEISCG